jgi:RecA-family ATPase
MAGNEVTTSAQGENKVSSSTMVLNDIGEAITLPALPQYDTLRGLSSERKPRDYVLPSFPVGKVGLLTGAGGTGKSVVAIQMAFQVAAGRACDFSLRGVTLPREQQCQVLYVSLEDEEADIDDRLAYLREYWQHDEEKNAWLHDLTELVHFVPLAGCGVTLVDNDCNRTPTFFAVIEKAKAIKYLRLIIVDTLRRAHDCEENSSGDMSKVLRHFEELAKITGASVLLIHHENKAGLGNKDAGAAASRGASSIVDNARYVARLQTMTIADAEKHGIDVEFERKHWIRFSLEKSNYGPQSPDAWLKRLSPKSPIMVSQVVPTPDETARNSGVKKTKSIDQSGEKSKTPSSVEELKSKKKITAKDIFG